MKRSALLVYLSLLADVVAFFHKPLFSTGYSFPWDFHGVQLPLVTFLADQLKQGRLALVEPIQLLRLPGLREHRGMLLSSSGLPQRPDQQPYLAGNSSHAAGVDRGLANLVRGHRGVSSVPGASARGGRRPGPGAVIFQTGGYFASRAEHIGAIMAVAWMPLAWLAILKLRHGLAAPSGSQRWRRRLGMAILGGFPQPTLAVFVSTVVFALTLVALRLARIQLIAPTAAGCMLGIALAAIQFIPTVQLSQHSVAKYRAGWLGTGGGLYWQSLVSLVLPNHYNLFDMQHFHGPGDITFLYLYSSIAGLSLAVDRAISAPDAVCGALGIMLLVGLLWMLGDKTVLWRLVYPLLPETVQDRHSSRVHLLHFHPGAGGLGGHGTGCAAYFRQAALVGWRGDRSGLVSGGIRPADELRLVAGGPGRNPAVVRRQRGSAYARCAATWTRNESHPGGSTH